MFFSIVNFLFLLYLSLFIIVQIHHSYFVFLSPFWIPHLVLSVNETILSTSSSYHSHIDFSFHLALTKLIFHKTSWLFREFIRYCFSFFRSSKDPSIIFQPLLRVHSPIVHVIASSKMLLCGRRERESVCKVWKISFESALTPDLFRGKARAVRIFILYTSILFLLIFF